MSLLRSVLCCDSLVPDAQIRLLPPWLLAMSHRLIPGTPVNIRDLPTDGREFCSSRKKAERESKELREELIELQPRMYAEDKHRLLIVLQAMDEGGKDSAIRKVFRGVNPQGVRHDERHRRRRKM